MNANAGTFMRWEARRRAAAGDHEGALELIRLIGTGDAEAAVLRGRIHAQRGEFAAAAAAFREALEQEPGSPEAKRGLELAGRLAASPIAWLRVRWRIWVVVAALAAAAWVGWWGGVLGGGVSHRDLSAALAALDRKMEASNSNVNVNSEGLAERLSRLEKALQTQSDANGKANQQVRAQLLRMQEKLAGAVTEEQLRAVRAEMVESLRRLETTMGQAPRR